MKDGDFYHHIDQLVEEGYTILPPQLTETECDEAQRQLDRLHVEREHGGFELIFNKAQIFERLYRIEPLLRTVRHFLGEDALLSSMHGSVLTPGAGKGGLHSDGAITGHNRAASMSAADGGQRITSHVLALNSIWCISEFTAENGATQLVPGSQTHPDLEIRDDALERATIAVAPRGSVIVFNVNVWHGPSENRTDQNRYAVLNPWRRHWTRCEYEMAEMVKPEVLERAGDARVVFGLDAQAPYVERWQWDREEGTPTAEFRHLAHRDGR
jgi:ectoine hydroxylase-related dioxygenase (phytanoyl-CoA dioxygenase family)